ncbi:MAG: hypothetical protein ACHQHN_17080 [Sphingobacteriales bacterium]
MKNGFFYYILALLFFLCVCNKARAQNIQAEAKLQQYTIKIGDQTKLFIAVHQPANVHVIFPKLTDTITSKIQVVNISKPDTAYDKDNHDLLTVTQGYTITCFDAGTYSVPPFSISSGDSLIKTNALTLQIETVKVDTTKAIYDIKQPIAVSYTFFDWLADNWYWIVIPCAVMGLIIGTLLYLRKRPKAEPVVQTIKQTTNPDIIALSNLTELKEKKLWQQGQVKEYHIELSDIIREYLEKRYRIKTHEKTTDEIFADLKYRDIADENRNKLRQMLVLADLVKFAKEKPLPVDNEQTINNAIDFVKKTRQADLRPAKEGGTSDV